MQWNLGIKDTSGPAILFFVGLPSSWCGAEVALLEVKMYLAVWPIYLGVLSVFFEVPLYSVIAYVAYGLCIGMYRCEVIIIKKQKLTFLGRWSKASLY